MSRGRSHLLIDKRLDVFPIQNKPKMNHRTLQSPCSASNWVKRIVKLDMDDVGVRIYERCQLASRILHVYSWLLYWQAQRI